MSSATRSAAADAADRAKFNKQIERAELDQAVRYLKSEHRRADRTLRETSQSVFNAAAGGGGGGGGDVGVIYGGKQVRAPKRPLVVAGRSAT